MKINIEVIPSYEIAYIRSIGPYGIGNVQAMEKLKKWANERDLLNLDSILLGIPQDNPSITKAEDCRYDSCIVISKESKITETYLQQSKIEGGKYAIFQIDHTSEAVQKAWVDVFIELNKNSYIIDTARPIIERYASKMIVIHKCEICVPIL